MFKNSEDIGWQLNVAESLLELDARQQALIRTLVDLEIMTPEYWQSILRDIKETEYYKKNFELIKKGREALEEPFDLLDLIKSVKESNGNDKN